MTPEQAQQLGTLQAQAAALASQIVPAQSGLKQCSVLIKAGAVIDGLHLPQNDRGDIIFSPLSAVETVSVLRAVQSVMKVRIAPLQSQLDGVTTQINQLLAQA